MNSIYGHYGQAGRIGAPEKYSPSSLTVAEVKALHSPRVYYPRILGGRFGKLGATGWCQWVGVCPFHCDKRAGSVSIHLSTGAYKCFACGAAAGDVIAFHSKLKGLTFTETLADLGGRL